MDEWTISYDYETPCDNEDRILPEPMASLFEIYMDEIKFPTLTDDEINLTKKIEISIGDKLNDDEWDDFVYTMHYDLF